jgi:serine phosphatase RsbU (regulator of sigma subunit)
MFRPRDIVSGDFYWYTLKNGKKIIAAVDCTGHSVPGAFMSMIGNAFLNEIVNEKGITQPAAILDLLKERVVMSLKQGENDNKDGMDMAIIAVDETSNMLEFAGANNPCWHLRNGVLTEIKGDKQPIAFQAKGATPFTNHTMQLQANDCLYIFTDGYADQFGGVHGKKFKYKPLKELFIQIWAMPFSGQANIVKTTFDNWKGNLDQVDDVCVIGLKV